MTEISASILSANASNLGAEVKSVINAGISSIHFDVMDMNYVPNLTFGPGVLADLKPSLSDTPVNVHLMVTKVNEMVPLFAKSGASCLIFHPHTVSNINKTIDLIRQSGCKVGIAINPDEPISLITRLIPRIDRILLMSVFPGFAGQKFILETIDRLSELRKLTNCTIEVDGGIKLDNCKSIADAGANSLVVGSGLFDLGNDYKNYVAKFKTQVA